MVLRRHLIVVEVRHESGLEHQNERLPLAKQHPGEPRVKVGDLGLACSELLYIVVGKERGPRALVLPFHEVERRVFGVGEGDKVGGDLAVHPRDVIADSLVYIAIEMD